MKECLGKVYDNSHLFPATRLNFMLNFHFPCMIFGDLRLLLVLVEMEFALFYSTNAGTDVRLVYYVDWPKL